jgi:copper(I)-binding protein
MDDRFDERLRTRLSALDAAVPTVERDLRGVGAARRPGRRVSTSAGLPLGLAAGLVVAVVAVAIVGTTLRVTQNGSAPVAIGPVATEASPVATGAGTQSPAQGMTITDAQALPIAGVTNPVIVTATIANGTGRDDKLLGGSSPVAAAVGLYGTCGCSPAPTDPVTGIPGVAPFPWWLIKANETIQLRAGDGEMVLSGLSQPLVAGQTVEVTFKFAYAAPVTVQIPVVSAIGTAAMASS